MKKLAMIAAILMLCVALLGCSNVDKRLVGSWIDDSGQNGFTLEEDLRGSVNIAGVKTPMVYRMQGDRFYISYMDPVEISDLEFDSNAISTIRNYISNDADREESIITFFGSYEFVLETPPGSGNTVRYRKLAQTT